MYLKTEEPTKKSKLVMCGSLKCGKTILRIQRKYNLTTYSKKYYNLYYYKRKQNLTTTKKGTEQNNTIQYNTKQCTQDRTQNTQTKQQLHCTIARGGGGGGEKRKSRYICGRRYELQKESEYECASKHKIYIIYVEINNYK